jgi:hypothetical protein
MGLFGTRNHVYALVYATVHGVVYASSVKSILVMNNLEFLLGGLRT